MYDSVIRLHEIIDSYDTNLFVCQLPSITQRDIIHVVGSILSKIVDIDIIQSILDNRLNNLENILYCLD